MACVFACLGVCVCVWVGACFCVYAFMCVFVLVFVFVYYCAFLCDCLCFGLCVCVCFLSVCVSSASPDILEPQSKLGWMKGQSQPEMDAALLLILCRVWIGSFGHVFFEGT